MIWEQDRHEKFGTGSTLFHVTILYMLYEIVNDLPVSQVSPVKATLQEHRP